ncbi:MAG: RSP_2648 family PIN domain-containing protein [Lutimaribacter sp.]
MKVLLDTCVLYPTVMRQMLLGVAAQGVFQPRWSARILEEWARAARKLGPGGEAQARAEAAQVSQDWPDAVVHWPPSLEARLWLPDPGDTHVLAAAIAGHCDVIITQNRADFPRHILAEEGLARADADGFLHGIWQANPQFVQPAAWAVLEDARRLSGQDWQMRALLKKARLPRLARALQDLGAP